MKTQHFKNILLASVATGLALPASSAFAQENKDIVVLARKRNESIMNVPVVASVLSADQLDNQAVGDIKDIANMVPGLNYQEGNNSTGTMVSLRGIGTSTNNPAIDQSVSLVIDGQQFSQGLAFQASSFDMARVEVLKGPQALFYGKAAPAGVISIRTADPTDKFEASLRGGYEFYALEKVGEAVISGPVSDTLRLRLAAQYSDADGYFRNTSNPPAGAAAFGALPPRDDRVPATESVVVRGTALWNPTETFDARLKLNYVHQDTQGRGATGQIASCPEGTASRLPLPYSPIAGDDCKLDRNWPIPTYDQTHFGDRTLLNNGVPYNENEQLFGSLELNYDFSDSLKLTSLTSYYNVDQDSLGETTVGSNVGVVFPLDGRWNRKDVTQELRLSSDFSGPLNFMVGGFYQSGEVTYAFDLPVNLDIIALRVPLPTSLGQYSSKIDIDTYSLFGQAQYNITPKLELSAGARWTKETRDIVPTLVTGPSYSPAGTVIPILKNRLSPENWSPELTLTYKPTSDLTIFGALKQAYKSGSYDVGGTITPGTDISFGDERVRSAELGLKSRLLDGGLRFNAAAYYQEYEGLQVKAGTVVTSGGIAVRTFNAASADIYGVDADFTYYPADVKGLSFNGGVNWNHARYSKFPNAPCWFNQTIAEGCNQLLNKATGLYTAQDLSKQELVRAPEWSANLGFNFETPIASDLLVRFGSSLHYSSSYSTHITNYYSQSDYTKFGATFGIGSQDDRWTFDVVGSNLTDEYTTGACEVDAFADSLVFARSANRAGATTRGPTGLPEVLCFPDAGRSVLARLTFRY